MKHSAKTEVYKYLFGPVPSRRLGRSLGVDLVPYKTCSLDCVYCESGKTTTLTSERKLWVPVNKVMDELQRYLASSPVLDYITFSGGGEPLLNSGLPDVVNFLKFHFPSYKLALITNSTQLINSETRNDVKDIDLIVASLDAVTEKIFQKINRPEVSLTASKIIQGLSDLRLSYKNELWLEVFIIPGVNDSINELNAIKHAAEYIGVDKIQLNSLDRPGTEPWVKPVNDTEIKQISELFSAAEAVSYNAGVSVKYAFNENVEESIISMLRRRPCTAKDISLSLAVDHLTINATLECLVDKRVINQQVLKRGVFYTLI